MAQKPIISTQAKRHRANWPDSLPCRRLFFLCLVFLTATHSLAQSPRRREAQVIPVIDGQDILFRRLTSGGEALNRWVRGITQDNRGFMWFASDAGLFRYDGYVLKQYRHDPANPNTIASDDLKAMFKDRDGSLWISTITDGIDRFDPDREVFTHFRHAPSVQGSLSSNQVSAAYQDRAGVLWVGTNDAGLNRLNPQTGIFQNYRHDPADPASLTGGSINRVFEDSRGNFWVGTSEGLNLMDRATGRCSRFTNDPSDPNSLGEAQINVVWEDRSGTIWTTSTFGFLLSALDVKTGKVRRYSLRRGSEQPEDISGVTNLHEDPDGVIWLGTVKDGLLRMDRDRDEFLRYTKDFDRPGSLNYRGVSTIFEDREGTIWIGNKAGVVSFLRKRPAFVGYRPDPGNSNRLQDGVIWSTQADSRGFLWVGTEDGLHRLDPRTGRFKVFRHNPADRHSLSHNLVAAIREDSSGRLWFGTYGGGLNRFDPETERFYSYRGAPRKPGGLPGDLIFTMLMDRNGALWIAVQGEGLVCFDSKSEKFRTYHPGQVNPLTGFRPHVTALFEGAAGHLWVGTLSGLYRYSRESDSFVDYGSQSGEPLLRAGEAIASLHGDRNGTLWVGTREGLVGVDTATGSTRKYTTKEGLADNYVAAILEDDGGSLWLATHNGLSRFNPRTGEFRNYSESDGLTSNQLGPYGPEAVARLSDGRLVFGSTDGLTVLNPALLSTNTHVPPVLLTDFTLFRRSVEHGEDSPLKLPIWSTSSITLSHEQNIFAFGFAALSFVAPEKNRYRFRLENFESSWTEGGSSIRRAPYTNLPPGDYVLRVQGSNNDLVWNEAGVRLHIRVLPPWWATWWFRLTAGLFIAGVVFLAYRFRVRHLRRLAINLENEVAKRTSELEAARISAETADRTKSSFLSHMSHELRTPLNAILGFAKLLQASADSLEQRNGLKVIHRSAAHLLSLIDHVLDYAKVEARKSPLEIGPCDITRLTADIVSLMRPGALAKDLQIRLALSSAIPRNVLIDGSKLRQILINLLGNAIKYTRRGTVTLRVDLMPADQPAASVLVFEVEDTGVGIAVEDQTRIFEPFVQLGLSGEQSGSGLGLAISRQFVIMLGGAISLKSAPDQGSIFRVELPVSIPEQSESSFLPEDRDVVYKLEPDQPAPRILVAEDDTDNRNLLKTLISQAGFVVETAVDGAEAVEKFSAWQPHLIWMDIRMPNMDGIEAARRIRALAGGKDVKIVASTASVQHPDAAGSMNGLMDDLVVKPFTSDAVFACLRQHLGVPYRAGESALIPSAGLSGNLPPASLRALPDGLRAELKDAILALNTDRIAAAIQRISALDPVLGSALTRAAGQFSFTAIFNAIEPGEEVPPGAPR